MKPLPRIDALVEVYCKGKDGSHARYLVERFGKMGTGDWLPTPWLDGDKPLRRKESRAFIDANTNRHIPADWRPGDGRFDATGFRVRDSYNLPCGECGRRVPAPQERLEPIFDAVVAKGLEISPGVYQISLAELATMLKRSETG